MATAEGRGRLRPRRRAHQPRRRRVLSSRTRPRASSIVLAHGPAHDAGPVHAPHPGDVRRPGPDERRQRPGRGRGAWAAGAHLHDIRQGLRTFSTSFFQAPGRLNLSRSPASGWSSTTATTSTACASLADFVNRMMAEPVTRPGRARRSGTSRPATGAQRPRDRRHRHSRRPARRGPARLRRARRHGVRRDHRPRGQATCAAGRPARRRRTSSSGVRAARGGRVRRGRPGRRRSWTRRRPSGRRCAGPAPGDLVVMLRRRCGRRLPRGDGPRPARPAAARRSPIRASSRRPWADGRPPPTLSSAGMSPRPRLDPGNLVSERIETIALRRPSAPEPWVAQFRRRDIAHWSIVGAADTRSRADLPRPSGCLGQLRVQSPGVGSLGPREPTPRRLARS